MNMNYLILAGAVLVAFAVRPDHHQQLSKGAAGRAQASGREASFPRLRCVPRARQGDREGPCAEDRRDQGLSRGDRRGPCRSQGRGRALARIRRSWAHRPPPFRSAVRTSSTGAVFPPPSLSMFRRSPGIRRGRSRRSRRIATRPAPASPRPRTRSRLGWRRGIGRMQPHRLPQPLPRGAVGSDVYAPALSRRVTGHREGPGAEDRGDQSLSGGDRRGARRSQERDRELAQIARSGVISL